MFRQTIKIKKLDVLFVRIDNRAGWFVNYKGKEYGTFVKIDAKYKEITNKELIIILKDQAEKSIIEVKQK